MLANWPPLGCSQVQTRGGTYTLLSAITAPFAVQPEKELGTAAAAFQCQRLYRADGQEAGEGTVPIPLHVLDHGRAFGELGALGFRARSLLGRSRLRFCGAGRFRRRSLRLICRLVRAGNLMADELFD